MEAIVEEVQPRCASEIAFDRIRSRMSGSGVAGSAEGGAAGSEGFSSG